MIFSHLFLLALILLVAHTAAAEHVTMLIQAESAGPADSAEWVAQEFDGAIGGRVLYAAANRRNYSGDLALPIPQAGAYRIWVRYHRDQAVSPAFYVVIFDEQHDSLAFHWCDYASWLPTEKPYESLATYAGEQLGFIWEPFDATFERPVNAVVNFGPLEKSGQPSNSNRRIDCIILSTDPTFDPRQLDDAQLAALAAAGAQPVVVPAAPAGFVHAAGSPAHVDDYAGVDQNRWQAGMCNVGNVYFETGRFVRLGFSHDHAWMRPQMVKHGVYTHGYVEGLDHGPMQILGKQYKAPEGRVVNSKGEVGRLFSVNFPPSADAVLQALTKRVKTYLEQPWSDQVTAWRISTEGMGFTDYSPSAITAFRKWLEEKHGNIATLNQRWNTSYQSFAEITPPAEFVAGPAAWLELRDFSSESFVHEVASQNPVVAALDPRKRPTHATSSALYLLAPYFCGLVPGNMDQLLSTAYADAPYVSWDTYSSGDQITCETDMMRSFGDGRKPVVQEWANHPVDARIAARSYWSMVAKNVAGIYPFMFHEGLHHATYPKWGLTSINGSPKPKLAAYSDAVQAVHQIEPLLVDGKFTHPVKPIAMYWSRIDLTLAKPHTTMYSQTVNNPVIVYAVLRSLGYPVRWITPRQVRRGDLQNVSALVMVGCRYMPGDVADSVAAWVKQGGAIVADELPGAWNEYGQPQTTLAPLFGVEVKQSKNSAKAGSTIAIEQSSQGYGEETDKAVNRTETFTMNDEVSQQPGATHPVARAVGDFTVSGLEPVHMKAVAGHVVGMTHRGNPGFVVNEFGQGKAFYSSLMLGTIHAAAPTGYEWQDTLRGMGWHHMLDAFLTYAGAEKVSTVAGVNEFVAAKLRIESPIVTAAGNVSIGMTSLNDAPVGPLELRVKLPANVEGPFVKVFAIINGSRQLLPLTWRVGEGALHVTMPTFDTHAMILALRDTRPMISLELPGVARDEANLATIATDQTFAVIATIYNLSPRELSAGKLTLDLPAGWLQSQLAHNIAPIAPGASAQVTFTCRAPALAGIMRLRPLLTRYQTAEVKSTPGDGNGLVGAVMR